MRVAKGGGAPGEQTPATDVVPRGDGGDAGDVPGDVRDGGVRGESNLHANSCNPTLRCLPALTQNPAIVEQLVEAWRRATARWSPAQLRDGGRRGEALDGLALKFWPLLRARALPPPSVAGRRRRENHQGKDRARVRGGTPGRRLESRAGRLDARAPSTSRNSRTTSATGWTRTSERARARRATGERVTL